jgi:DNA-binding CsgD family transcriptional regulator
LIKPHCTECGRPYLGRRCGCRTLLRRRGLRCDCKRPAVEVYVDALGEWALCEVCLEEVLNEERHEAGKPGVERQRAEVEGEARARVDRRCPQVGREMRRNPYGLSKREMEVAELSHLRRNEIASVLGISPSTVKAHLNTILAKMRIHSKGEIQERLERRDGGGGDD